MTDIRGVSVVVTRGKNGLEYEFQPLNTDIPHSFKGEILVTFAADKRGCTFGSDGRLSGSVQRQPGRATPVMIRIPWENPHPDGVTCVTFDVTVFDKGKRVIGHRHRDESELTSHEAVIRNVPPG